MGLYPFETFCEMIDGLPPKAVLQAVAVERFMLEEDLAQGRTLPNDDTGSILSFCRFLEDAAHDELVLPSTMSMEHWVFYGKTVERLVAVGELPHEVQDGFETAFHDVFSHIKP